MIYAKLIVQIILISLFIYYVSGKLMGSQINFMKRILSVFISIVFTFFVYWYAYLRNIDFLSEDFVYSFMDVSTIIWIGSMLLISMLLYLFFELFGPMDNGERKSSTMRQRPFLLRLRSQWRGQKRMRQVIQIAAKNGISRALKYTKHRDNDYEMAIAFRDTLEQAGGIFIKFGQVLSTRKDLFSPVFIRELEKLQQNVEPLHESEVKKILDKSLPCSMEDIFSYFDMIPLASASIGQVHKAVLKENNQQVVVKLLRPDVKSMIRDDLNILLEFVRWLTDKSSWAERLGLCELALGFADNLKEEVNFEIEKRNAVQVKNALKNSKYEVKIPYVYTDLSNKNIIIFEHAYGQSVANGDSLFQKLNIDREEFAQTVLYSFFDQMLYSGIFHADPHPGNIFIDKTDGLPILLDFGAVGRLAEPQQEGMKIFLMGIQHNDANMLYDAVTLLVEDHDHIDRVKMEQALSQILLRISYVERIPTDELIQAFFKLVREFGLSFYPSVGIAMRSIITLEGTLKLIQPKFDIFAEAKEYSSDYLTSLLKKPFKEPKVTKERIEEEFALLLPAMRKIPRRVDKLVQKVESGKIILHHDIFSDKNNAQFVTHLFSRFILLFVGITFGIISVSLLAIAQFIETAYAVYLNTAAFVGLFLCAVLLVRLSIQAIRLMKRH
ncbi:ABC1 kinase family protein [Psychrobacillus sp. NPDC093200]|uniref:ABC1 kinase family protein n=1 Tax=Psychrobacillus sp. NPDC093200 TaxID=3390656 RepID=UPI003CFC76C0